MILQVLRSSVSVRDKFIILVAFIGAAMLSIIVHEVAHGYVALKNGDPTAKWAGRLTLNPKSHFDLWGILMFLFIGVGWAKPVPVNYDNFTKKRRGIVTVSLAGVTANLIMAFLAFGLLALTALIISKTTVESYFAQGIASLFIYFFNYLITVNICLIAFNILPIFPLDGFRVVQAFFPNSKYVSFMYRYGSMTLLILIVGGSLLSVISPYLDVLGLYIGWVYDLVFGLINKLWGAIVGVWIW